MAASSIQFPDKTDIKDRQLNELFPFVMKAVQFLNNTNDYTTKEVGKTLAFLDDVFWKDQTAIPQEGFKHGLGGKLFVKIWKALSDHHTPSDRTQGGCNLKLMTGVFVNYTNDCSDIGCDLGKHGAIDCIIDTLKKLEEQPEIKWKTKEMDSLIGIREWKTRELNTLLSILHNSVKHDECAPNRSRYRKAELDKPLKKLIDSSELVIKLNSLLVFSYIARDSESEMLGRDKDVVVFLMRLLKKAVNAAAPKHECSGPGYAFGALDLLMGVHNLVVNDANKRIVLADQGILIITRMLRNDFSEKDNQAAVKALWNLSFDEDVRQSDDMRSACSSMLINRCSPPWYYTGCIQFV